VHPTVYVIAGSNGAGKTTFARRFLPEFAHCDEFVNPDLIAAGLSPFTPRDAAIPAARLVLSRIQELSRRHVSFGFETTLAGRTYLQMLRTLKRQRYAVYVFYLWLPDAELAVQRVHDRVRQGGHSVPDRDVRRRYGRGLRHFLLDYQQVIDDWILIDNAQPRPLPIAFGQQRSTTVIDSERYSLVRKQAGL
jgi:predicted ABC-type ATPase